MKITKILFTISVLIAWTFLMVIFTGTYMSSNGKTGNNNLNSGKSSSNLNPSLNSVSTVQLTAAEVAKHNTASDCWMIINNKIYDVTSYMNSHPGGTGTIAEGCGKDGTQLFDTKGGTGNSHSATADSILGSFYIGDLNQNLTPSQIQNRTASAGNATIPNKGREDDERD